MKTLALALALALAAAPARAVYEYDCAEDQGRKDFREALSRFDKPLRDLVMNQKVPSRSDARSCTLYEWCLSQRAGVKFSEGVIVLKTLPETSCKGSWEPVCESTKRCGYGTHRLVADKPDSAAVLRRDDAGQVKAGIKTLWDSGGGLGAATGGGEGWRGLSFSWRDETYRVQHKTLFIFRQASSGLEDTKATLPEDVLADVCANSGAAVAAACEAGLKAGCAELGLSPVKGKKGRFRDARGGSWRERSGSCQPGK